MSDKAESKKIKKKSEAIKTWQTRLEQEDKVRSKYRDRCRHIEAIYSGRVSPFDINTGEDSPSIDYNILWVNCQILLAALYSRNPAPDVRRRYKDTFGMNPPDMQNMDEEQAQQVMQEMQLKRTQYDKTGKDIAVMLERALAFVEDMEDYYGNASAAVLSFVKFGAGLMRVRYCPYVKEGMPKKITVFKNEEDKYMREDGEELSVDMYEAVEIGEDGLMSIEIEEEGTIEYEEIQPEFVPMSRFHWECVSAWKDVSWCVIDHYLSFDELCTQFGEKVAKEIPLSYGENGDKPGRENRNNKMKPTRALVRECFDRRALKVQIYAEGYDVLLEDLDDPYDLMDFYPFPKPMFGTMGDDGLNPVPEYIYYQDQHAELNTITQRIDKLLQVVKYRGFYDGSGDTFVEIDTMQDGDFKPLSNYAELVAAMGGSFDMNKMIAAIPTAQAQQILNSMYQYRDQVVKVIYEITGISDIVRGSSKASETLGAQELKSQYANLRLQSKQQEVERFFRDIFRIEAELLAEKFEIPTLEGMTGVTITPEMQEIMSSDLLRSYVIDVESDSTVLLDTQREQKERSEAIAALTSMFQQLAPLTQIGLPLQFVGQMLLFGLKGFKGARELEDSIQDMLDNLGQQQGQPGQEEQENPMDAIMLQKAQEEARGLKIDNDLAESGILEFIKQQSARA